MFYVFSCCHTRLCSRPTCVLLQTTFFLCCHYAVHAYFCLLYRSISCSVCYLPSLNLFLLSRDACCTTSNKIVTDWLIILRYLSTKYLMICSLSSHNSHRLPDLENRTPIVLHEDSPEGDEGHPSLPPSLPEHSVSADNCRYDNSLSLSPPRSRLNPNQVKAEKAAGVMRKGGGCRVYYVQRCWFVGD